MKKEPFLLLTLIFLFACNKDDLETSLNTDITSSYSKKYIIALDTVKMVAENFLFGDDGTIIFRGIENMEKSNEIALSTRKVESWTSISDSNNAPAFYIMNYTEGGFSILAADKRVNPILAFSNSGYFNYSDSIPIGLEAWLYDTQEYIESLRNNDSTLIDKQWDQLLSTLNITNVTKKAEMTKDSIVEDPPDCTGYPITNIVGPLLETQWSQECGYNSDCPFDDDGPCDHALVGCVAVAMGQVMKYWESPVSSTSIPSYFSSNYGVIPGISPTVYDWSNMLPNYGNSAVATLLYNCGVSLTMDYGASGSSSETEDVPYALKNYFGYSSATFRDYGTGDDSKVKVDLNNGRPVILAAHRKENILSYKGHAWVCHGYRNIITCDSNNGNITSSLWFMMNWGSAGDYDGYYAFLSWSPGSYDYKYNKRMVYQIEP